MTRVLLQLVWLVAFAFGKMLAPMRPDTALELLDRLNSYLRSCSRSKVSRR